MHTLPFLISTYSVALIFAIVAVALELVALAPIRWRFFKTPFLQSFASIALGGVIIVGVSTALGGAAG